MLLFITSKILLLTYIFSLLSLDEIFKNKHSFKLKLNQTVIENLHGREWF